MNSVQTRNELRRAGAEESTIQAYDQMISDLEEERTLSASYNSFFSSRFSRYNSSINSQVNNNGTEVSTSEDNTNTDSQTD